MDGGLFPEPKIKTGQIKNPSCLNLSVQTGGIFLLCEIIGMITEIVSNQYHLLVLIRKVIALQRLFNFCCHGANPFSLISMAEKSINHVYEMPVL
ncbi:MAG: hypothetical protein IJN67_12150 [Oscillospiraceae bacterium]|nr:hypothetical protein [Oscillospiraceae bacterium]